MNTYWNKLDFQSSALPFTDTDLETALVFFEDWLHQQRHHIGEDKQMVSLN